MKTIVAIPVVIVIGLPADIFAAYITLNLWEWFVVPLGIQMVGFWQMYGLVMLKVLLFHNSPKKYIGLLEIMEISINKVTMALVVWGFAGIAHALMNQ